MLYKNFSSNYLELALVFCGKMKKTCYFFTSV